MDYLSMILGLAMHTFGVAPVNVPPPLTAIVRTTDDPAADDSPVDEDWNGPPPPGVDYLETGSCTEDNSCPDDLGNSDLANLGGNPAVDEPDWNNIEPGEDGSVFGPPETVPPTPTATPVPSQVAPPNVPDPTVTETPVEIPDETSETPLTDIPNTSNVLPVSKGSN